VEARQEIPHGARCGQGEAQAARQAGVAFEEGKIIGTIPANDLEQEQRLDELGLGAAAVSGFEREVGLDQGGQVEAAQSAGGGEEAGVGRTHFGEGPGVKAEGRLGLEWESSWHDVTRRYI